MENVTVFELLESGLCYKHCVITGKLERYTRREALEVIEEVGGIGDRSVTRRTQVLILGDNKGRKSKKQLRAEKLGIEIITEDEFYKTLGIS